MDSMQQTENDSDQPATQRYEVILIIANKYSEAEVEPIVSAITKLVRDSKGTIIAEENWGKRKLAYPIKHFFHAYYHLIECELPTEATPKINNALRLNEYLLRHLIVQKRIKSETELEQEQAAAKRIAKQEKAAAADAAVKTAAITPSKSKEPVDVKALDEKLDKILDDTQDLL